MSLHPELRLLQHRLQKIYEDISDFKPATVYYPILDSSLDGAGPNEEGQQSWSQQGQILGLKRLKESLKVDLEGLKKFLEDPKSVHLPPLSTNAPYLISVWNEVLCAAVPILCVFKTFLFDPSNPIPSAQRKQGVLRPPGAKVDVVADNGRQWIRINTIKNARLISELREIDSYQTDSEPDSEWDEARPTLAQRELDNSILRMGKALISAAKANPVEGTNEIPQVVMRLTRLETHEGDPRIAQTIKLLQDIGIQVELGERSEDELPFLLSSSPQPQSLPSVLHPSPRINLDLSVLIALVSDLTHAPLPKTLDDAKKRFIPPKEYREWKERRRQQLNKNGKVTSGREEEPSVLKVEGKVDLTDLPQDLATHSRALQDQLLQEMGKSLIQEIWDQISSTPHGSQGHSPSTRVPVEFWTTTEARDRCLRIVSKIGGANEKRRVYSLFCLNPSSPQETIPLSQAKEFFWRGSRFKLDFLPLFPLHFHSSSLPSSSPLLDERGRRGTFFRTFAQTCHEVLAHETTPHSRSNQPEFISQATTFPFRSGNSTTVILNDAPSSTLTLSSPAFDDGGNEIQRAAVTKVNTRVTAHTVESLLWGTEMGWTTLTANRTSIKVMLKELRIVQLAGKFDDLEVNGVINSSLDTEIAAIWIVDPRSLAEQMSSDNV